MLSAQGSATIEPTRRARALAWCASFALGMVMLVAADPSNSRADEPELDDDAILAAVEAAAASEEFAEAPPIPTALEAAAVGNDELWFVSSRRARYTPDGPTGLQVWKYDGVGNWNAATLDDLAAADSALPTCFHVHGNRVGLAQANSGGWRFYTALTADDVERRAMRFVVFSWPSGGVWGSQRDDVRAKAVVAESHSYFLAHVVDRMPQAGRVNLIGYSYGARLIGGALHLLGGGTLRGRSLGERLVADRRVRTVFLAAALDNGSFMPGCSFAAAPTQIERLLVCRNACDKTLKWYPLLYRLMLRPQRGVQAMGYAGIGGLRCTPELAEHVEQVDVSCLVGNAHDWHGFEYLRGSLPARIRAFLGHDDAESPVVVETAAR